MAVFFFVVGMEIKRELVVGELRDRRSVALPAMAALGGMVVPAAIYLAINAGGDGRRGWGIPMATDIAFALGVVALLGSRVPAALKVLLLTLAIVDDIGAIVVIAVFYTDDLDLGMLAAAAGGRRGDRRDAPGAHRVPAAAGPRRDALWLAVYESGVHATIAGVVLGLLTPARPFQTELEAEEIVDVLEGRPDLRADDIRATATADLVVGVGVRPADRRAAPVDQLRHRARLRPGQRRHRPVDATRSPSRRRCSPASLSGWSSASSSASPAFAWLAVRLGLGRLPEGVRWGHIVGLGAVAGIGFTVSLFIAGLAFDTAGRQADAKIGTLAASIVAAVGGAVVLAIVARSISADGEGRG